MNHSIESTTPVVLKDETAVGAGFCAVTGHERPKNAQHIYPVSDKTILEIYRNTLMICCHRGLSSCYSHVCSHHLYLYTSITQAPSSFL